MLVEVCSRHCPSYHVETVDELRQEWFDGVEVVGVTAGASTRDSDIDAVVAWLEQQGTAPPSDNAPTDMATTAAWLAAALNMAGQLTDETEEETT